MSSNKGVNKIVLFPDQVITAGKPKITGTPTAGRTLTVNPGTWGPGTVKLSYRWYRSGKSISGAWKSSYKLTSADKGKTITINVVGARTGFTSVAAKASVKVKK